jgi:hypothetical protein
LIIGIGTNKPNDGCIYLIEYNLNLNLIHILTDITRYFQYSNTPPQVKALSLLQIYPLKEKIKPNQVSELQ